MLQYFYVLPGDWLSQTVQPALSASWRQRKFAPCRSLCEDLLKRQPIPDDAVLRAVLVEVPYDRRLWHALVGECLIFGAEALPRIPSMLDALACLQSLPSAAGDRHSLCPLEQLFVGSRDLRFAGGWHRPEHIGWNDRADVARLTTYVQSIDAAAWRSDALASLAGLTDAGERDEELAFVRDWWPALVEMYSQAQQQGQVIVCERA